jgi:hypothetical protein
VRKPKTKAGPEGYVDELEDWLESKQTGARAGQGDVAFLAVRSNVQAAIERGHTLKTVWSHLHASGKYQHRYETFLKHAAKHLGRPQSRKPSSAQERFKATANGPAKTAGFNFTATPNQEELI